MLIIQLIFQIVGIVVIGFIVIFAILFFLYTRLKSKATPEINVENMPQLRPIPIPTKDHKSFFVKILIMFYEVRRWQLVENWSYKLNDKTEIIIPEGFIFDGASIPRPFWALLSPVGLLLISGLIHDYGYTYNQLWKKEGDSVSEYRKDAGKEYWDMIFLDVGDTVNGFSLVNGIAWLGVRLGGSGTWKKHRKNNVEPKSPRL